MNNFSYENEPILIGIGANLPGPGGDSPLATCLAALRALDSLPGLRVRAVSRWYGSAPLQADGRPQPDQPPYVNGVALLHGQAEPMALLTALHAIEAAHDRRRTAPNAARTLDLDLLAMGERVLDGPDVILPHPRAHQRRFVLLPLLELCPDWTFGPAHLPAADWLAVLPAQPLWTDCQNRS